MPYDRGVARSCINGRQGKVADVRTEVHRPQGGIAPQGARVFLMDGTAVESAFALLLTKVTKEGLVPDTSRTTNVREGS